MDLRRACALGVLAAVVSLARPQAAPADEPPPPYEEHTAPLYLMISFDTDFVVTKNHPSSVIMVNVGSLVGGDGILDTRLAVNEALTTIEFPDGHNDPTFEELADKDVVPTVMPTYLSEFAFFADSIAVKTTQQALLGQIRLIHEQRHTRTYGSPRMTRELESRGHLRSKNRVARLNAPPASRALPGFSPQNHHPGPRRGPFAKPASRRPAAASSRPAPRQRHHLSSHR